MAIFDGVKSLLLSAYRSHFSFSHIQSLEKFCEPWSKPAAGKTLDLGCGRTPKNPFNAIELYGIDADYGVDEGKNIFQCDLGMEKLPFDDETFDYVTAFDLLEHIPRLAHVGHRRVYPFIELMNEVSRVLKNGGLFLSDTPAYPRSSAFTDPTHVNFITNQTFRLYFCAPHNWAQRYGFNGDFKLVRQNWHKENLLTLMSK